jgi:hypothetical protein
MMTPSRTLPGRVVAACAVALHLLLLGAAPLAEALAEARRGSQAHVEAEATKTCPPAHNALYCQLCRVLAGAKPATAAHPLVADHRSLARVPAELHQLHRSTPLSGSPLGPRAPPIS